MLYSPVRKRSTVLRLPYGEQRMNERFIKYECPPGEPSVLLPPGIRLIPMGIGVVIEDGSGLMALMPGDEFYAVLPSGGIQRFRVESAPRVTIRTSVKDLGLLVRISNVLIRSGVLTVGTLIGMTVTELCRHKGIKKGALSVIVAILKIHGLALKDE